MRRSDRMLSLEDTLKVIEKCDVCRLGMCIDNKPYVVPMNFGYEYESHTNQLKLYFHCANEGKKLDILRNNNNVYFEMDCEHHLIKGEIACRYTMEFESVMGSGTIKIIEQQEGKIKGLNHVMKKYADGENDFTYAEKMLMAVTVLELTVEEFSGKRLKK